MEVGFSGQNSQPTIDTGIFTIYITEFYVLVGVRLMEVGFSGQNSLVESAHNRDRHLYHLYNGILRSCRSKTDGGGILRAEFRGGIGPQPGARLSS
jgi:hypothetical protein